MDIVTITPTSDDFNDHAGASVSLENLIKLKKYADRINLENLVKVKTVLAGTQISVIYGRGIDFSEVRIYQPGDDIRHIDWRVTARTGKPHTKLFQEDRERPIYLLVDYGPSMFFGTQVSFKSVVAARAAAMIAWAAVKHGDRVGGFIYSGKQDTEIKPKSGTKGILPLLKALADATKAKASHAQGGALTSCLLKLRRVVKPGSLIFIFSDFSNLDNEAINHLTQLSASSTVIASYIKDPLEEQLPPPDQYTFSDGENFQTLNTADKALRTKFEEDHKKFVERLTTTFKRYRIPSLTLRTNDNVADKIIRFINQRYKSLDENHEPESII